MSRRSIALTLSILAAWMLVDSPGAEAQIFRRLESRIRSRIAAPPLTPPATLQPNASQGRPRPAANAAQPPTAAPLNARPSGRQSPQSDRGADLVDPDTQGRTANYSPGSTERFGNSILAPSWDDRTSPAPRPTLGIDVYESRGRIQGLSVTRIREQSKAAQAGLAVGDLIVAVDGAPTPTIASISDRVRRLEIGRTVRATVVRGNQTGEILIPIVASSVLLARPPVETSRGPREREPIAGFEQSPSPAEPTLVPVAEPIDADPLSGKQTVALGIDVEDSRSVRGAVVVAVEPSSPASSAGLRTGDRIVSVNGRFISGSDALIRELAGLSGEDSLRLQVVRGSVFIESVVDFDRSASEPKLATDPAAPETNNPSEGSSLLKGIGSALGGFLSGAGGDKKTETTERPANKVGDGDLSGNPSENLLIKPVPEDLMALGDEEPIKRVGFDSLVPPEPAAVESPEIKSEGVFEQVENEKELRLDPPSVESLELPPGKLSPVDEATEREQSLDELIAQLRAEVRMLEERLKELEKKN